LEKLQQIINKSKELAFDLNFTRAKSWKNVAKNRVLIGYMPIYIPREIIHAANGLPVGILGSGDRKQIIKGDAYYQSYICHIPRSIIELALDNHFNDFDAFLFPSICDVIRNLSGMFQLLEKGKFAKFFDFPQNFKSAIGGAFYISEMQKLLDKIYEINKVKVTTEKINHSIALYNKNRQLINEIYSIRKEFPWKLSAFDTYHLVRAGMVIPVEEHNNILEEVCLLLQNDFGKPMDNIKVVIVGAFCEQPPASLIKTIEMAGCYIIDDDFLLGSRWIEGDIDASTNNPLEAIADAYINKSTFSSSVFDVENPKEKRLINFIKKSGADGVIFAAPSFCDPALLDHPIMQKACDIEGLRYISFQYSENTGQFKVIKEQVGTFSDSIRLWA